MERSLWFIIAILIAAIMLFAIIYPYVSSLIQARGVSIIDARVYYDGHVEIRIKNLSSSEDVVSYEVEVEGADASQCVWNPPPGQPLPSPLKPGQELQIVGEGLRILREPVFIRVIAHLSGGKAVIAHCSVRPIGISFAASQSPITLESYQVGAAGQLLILDLRNRLTSPVSITSISVIGPGGQQLSFRLAVSSSTEIWGGDEFRADLNELQVKRVKSGLLLFEDFRDGYDSGLWETYKNKWATSTSFEIDAEYGLVIKAKQKSSAGSTPGCVGLRTTRTLNLGTRYVVEISMGKLSGVYGEYEVQYYQYSGVSDNPYSEYHYVFAWITSYYPPADKLSDVQAGRRYYGHWRREPYPPEEAPWLRKRKEARWTLLIDEDREQIVVYFDGKRYPDIIDEGLPFLAVTRPRLYFQLATWESEEVCAVFVRYVKIYRSFAFTVSGLKAGWEVWVTDLDYDTVLKRAVSSGSSVSLDQRRWSDNDPSTIDILYPIRGHVLVIFPRDALPGIEIQPDATRKVFLVFDDSLSPGAYLIVLTLSTGEQVTLRVQIS